MVNLWKTLSAAVVVGLALASVGCATKTPGARPGQVPGTPVARTPSLPGEWLAAHDVPASVVDWSVDKLPTPTGFRVEVAGRTPGGLALAVRCQNARPTAEKPQFVTPPLERVVLEFDQAWISGGDGLQLLCTAGGQQHREVLVSSSAR